jgi:hypothetical protein
MNIGNKEETLELKEQYNLNLPVLFAPADNSLEKDYKIMGVPSFCYISPDGTVRRTGHSADLMNQLKTLI